MMAGRAIGGSILFGLLAISSVANIIVPRRLYRSPRIIGGSDASIKEFPYQLSLRINGRHWCGASVISDKWALTAAHCLLKASSPSDVTLRAGSSIYSSGGILVNAAQFHVHPKFNAQNGDFDVALIATQSSLSGPNIQKIDLPKAGTVVPVGAKATISGWGLTDPSSSINPLNLQFASVTVISQSECSKLYASYGGVNDVFFCASERGHDACQGDSGGPIVLSHVQMGVVSGGIGCAHDNYPGLYTRLSDPAVRSWIKTVSNI